MKQLYRADFITQSGRIAWNYYPARSVGEVIGIVQEEWNPQRILDIKEILEEEKYMWPFKKKKIFNLKYNRDGYYGVECNTYIAAWDIADAVRRLRNSLDRNYAVNIVAWEVIDKDGLKR